MVLGEDSEEPKNFPRSSSDLVDDNHTSEWKRTQSARNYAPVKREEDKETKEKPKG